MNNKNNQKTKVHSLFNCQRQVGQTKFRRVNIFISGRVQGVFFRQFAQEKAQELGLFGWVKNLADGRVEVLIEGDKEKIDKFLSYLKQGPPLAEVKDIEVNYQKYQDEFKTFEIVYH